jgi:hypothetical protein
MRAFSDLDGNAFEDPGEPGIEDASVRVEDEARSPVREILSRSDAPVCVPLATGVYYVVALPLAGYTATTPVEEVVLVTDGDTRVIRFGWYHQPVGTRIVHLPFAMRQVRPTR